MKYKFVYRPFVKQDLQNATNYYKAISPNLAKDFLDDLEISLNTLV